LTFGATGVNEIDFVGSSTEIARLVVAMCRSSPNNSSIIALILQLVNR
jgi:hypothetical protein